MLTDESGPKHSTSLFHLEQVRLFSFFVVQLQTRSKGYAVYSWAKRYDDWQNSKAGVSPFFIPFLVLS